MSAGHRNFSFDAPFVARDSFEHGGEQYPAGAPFPWRDLGVSERQLWNLWAARQVDNAAPAPAPAQQQPEADVDAMTVEELEAATAPAAAPAQPIATARIPAAAVATSEQPRPGRQNRASARR